MKRAFWLTTLALGVGSLLAALAHAANLPEASRSSAGRTVDFVRDIQPIFKASCYECHGPTTQKGRLRLDSKSIALQGGKSGKDLVPGSRSQSTLFQRLTSGGEERMPRNHDPLPQTQIDLIGAWIDNGAAWPESASVTDAAIAPHWSFVKPVRREIPAVHANAWVRNPIDSFVLSLLETRGLAPTPEASRETLIRRLSLDLVGIPPTPEEVDAFVADASPDAYERLVDRLLASPHYGERWGRHWLDLARYAESEGFKADETRPNAWRYRQYVIDAFNSDKPYDRFIREQIAGDELWPDDPMARVATAFNRHYPDESNARDLIQRRQEILNDVTDTVGSTFLGLTIGCARCHDHKYDEIRQTDYYRLQAFFANLRAADEIPLVSREAVREHDAKRSAWEDKTRDIREQMAAIEKPHRDAIIKEYVDKYPTEIRAMLDKPASERTPLEKQLVCKAAQFLDPVSYAYLAPMNTVAASLDKAAKKQWDELKAELDEYASLRPDDLPLGTGVTDVGRECPPTHLLRKGVYDAPAQEVEPGFPVALDPSAPVIVPPASAESSGRRTALAHWLASPENPLTARVMVNRIWAHHFGRGIVGSPSDFGVQGEPPSHPELLDWLATEFVRNGWSIKAMHRLIVTSATYRQGHASNAAASAIDPQDHLLWRFPRQRLDAEVVRDASLAVAGLLNLQFGGPSVFPEIPTGMDVRGGWSVSKDPAQRNRRSVYIFARRNTCYPMLVAFDLPEPHETCPRRFVTVSPAQALTLMNSKLSLDWAASLAGRVLSHAGDDRAAQMEWAYRLALGRKPSAKEMETVNRFFERHRPIVAARAEAGDKLAQPSPMPEKYDPAQGAVLVDFCHMLMNSNEFVYMD